MSNNLRKLGKKSFFSLPKIIIDNNWVFDGLFEKGVITASFFWSVYSLFRFIISLFY